MWIARNNDVVLDVNYKGGLYLFFTNDKPEYTHLMIGGKPREKAWLVNNNTGYYIDASQFPEITFENSPVEVEFKFK